LLVLPATPDRVNAYLSIDDDLYSQLRRDLRSLETPIVWVIKTEGSGPSKATWDPSRLPQGRFMINDVIDMKLDTICYFNLGDSLVIVWDLPSITSKRMEICPGWNMVSLPVVPPEYPPSIVFPETPVGMYEFNPQTRNYETTERFVAGKGYWLFSLESDTTWIAGMELNHFNANIRSGWNMIGTIAAPIAVSDISTSIDGSIVPPVFKYNCSTSEYEATDSLYPGEGYWLLSINDCVLTIPSGSWDFGKAFSTPIIPDWLASVTCDNTTLNFGYSTFAFPGLDRMDALVIPPSPAGYSIIRPYFLEDDFQMTKSISSNDIWSLYIPKNSDLTFTLPKEAGRLILEGNNTIYYLEDAQTISNVEAGLYRIYSDNKPVEFDLVGAYPNPFNSVVDIVFTLPEQHLVSVEIYDASGHKVSTVADKMMDKGTNTVKWNALNNVTSGLYFYRISYSNQVLTGSISLVK